VRERRLVEIIVNCRGLTRTEAAEGELRRMRRSRWRHSILSNSSDRKL
jgi:hypothetical protein